MTSICPTPSRCSVLGTVCCPTIFWRRVRSQGLHVGRSLSRLRSHWTKGLFGPASSAIAARVTGAVQHKIASYSGPLTFLSAAETPATGRTHEADNPEQVIGLVRAGVGIGSVTETTAAHGDPTGVEGPVGEVPSTRWCQGSILSTIAGSSYLR
jgi:DNA-binding transcriptional LysR family regulator